MKRRRSSCDAISKTWILRTSGNFPCRLCGKECGWVVRGVPSSGGSHCCRDSAGPLEAVPPRVLQVRGMDLPAVVLTPPLGQLHATRKQPRSQQFLGTERRLPELEPHRRRAAVVVL